MFLNRRTEIPLTDADPVIYVRARDSDQSSVGLTLSTLYRIYRIYGQAHYPSIWESFGPCIIIEW